jgi:hypothetical protein
MVRAFKMPRKDVIEPSNGEVLEKLVILADGKWLAFLSHSFFL